MELLTRLKASGAQNDLLTFDETLCEYERLRGTLAANDKSALAVGILCMLSRNLEKAPGWSAKADATSMLQLCVAAMRDVLYPDAAQRTRALAATFHLHRYATRQKVKADLVLRMSSFIFSDHEDNFIAAYSKTYWVILVDKLVYVEKLKVCKTKVKTFIPRITNDVKKVIHVYDCLQFCIENLNVWIKKLYHIFSDECPKDLDELFEVTFKSLLLKNDSIVNDSSVSDVYRKINDSFNVILDNASKYNFKTCAFATAVRFTSKLFQRHHDHYQCLTIYVKFSQIFENKVIEDVLKDLIDSITGLKTEAAKEMYPYFNQIIRTHIESVSKNYDPDEWMNVFTIKAQKMYIQLMAILMERLIQSPQVLKCVDCNLKTGLHDSLRLSFSLRNFITIPLKYGMDITENLPSIIRSFEMQTKIIQKLQKEKCANGEKCRVKAQTDLHNNGILLYRSLHYEYSLRLFNLYVRNEISMYVNADYSDRACLSRAFYNKAICELDMCRYEIALRDAYSSFVFADCATDCTKNLSLVIDIKSKAWKSKKTDDEVLEDPLQMMSVLEASKRSYESKEYGDLKPLLCSVEFSTLLHKEMKAYAQLWPSLLPIAGVLGSLLQLLDSTPKWVKAECREVVLWCLCEVVLSTACSARTLQHPTITLIVQRLLHILSDACHKTLPFRVAHCSILFLQAEIDLTEARVKYAWGNTPKNIEATDTEEMESSATLQQEHNALCCALQAVDTWTLLVPIIESRGTPEEPLLGVLCASLRIASASVAVLRQHGRDIHVLQLASVCVRLATLLRDDELLMANAGIMLSSALARVEAANALATKTAAALSKESGSEAALVYMCQAAMYHYRCGRRPLAASLLRYVQLSILAAETSTPGSMKLAVGYLLDAQALLLAHCVESDSRTSLTMLNSAHRHYLQMHSAGGSYVERRQRSSSLLYATTRAGAAAALSCARVLLARRARAAAAPALRTAAAGDAARLHAMVARTNLTAADVQVKIDNIKSILGVVSKPIPQKKDDVCAVVQPMKDLNIDPSKSDAIEAILDVNVFKKTQSGPASPYFDVEAFAMPEFLSHANACQCYACQNPWYAVISLELTGLEATTQYRNQEIAIARNYFNGALKIFEYVDAKIEHTFEAYRTKNYEEYVLDIAKDQINEELLKVKVDILMDHSFFLLLEEKYDSAQKYLKNIIEMTEMLKVEDLYLKNEILNLACAISSLKSKIPKLVESQIGIEDDLANLKLSPNATITINNPKTPNIKVEVPKLVKPKIVINPEDLPAVKRKVIKLNLDDNSPEADETAHKKKPQSKGTEFKIPVPKITQAVPQIITPRPTRVSKLPVKAKSRLLKTDSSDSDSSNKPSKTDKKIIKTTRNVKNPSDSDTESNQTETDSSEPKKEETNQSPDIFEEDVFYTPMSKPVEQFFTPMSIVKTYGKSLRHQIVKNLESEFQTPQKTSETPKPHTSRMRKTKSKDESTDTDSSSGKGRQKYPEVDENTKERTGQRTCASRRNIRQSGEDSKAVKNSKIVSEVDDQRPSTAKLKPNKSLKRATSPGKLNPEDMETRVRPVRGTRLQHLRKEKLKLSPDETLLKPSLAKK